ncbi:alanine--tRNA ligase, putative [Plasmodium ovale wallikeri]|uniref:Alanine--tRNA ligase n=1 Tax=Plasmodium ovale wallikeri TaxID=864142 RepID=A0A1A8YZC9_PLAOA|nr:alanine--tRNA ligase, putative [Plasmodium ovale wallikeri]SBT37343.1 alanine--tRNA ligase, putative [Plasmodium ovale wallikeri]
MYLFFHFSLLLYLFLNIEQRVIFKIGKCEKKSQKLGKGRKLLCKGSSLHSRIKVEVGLPSVRKGEKRVPFAEKKKGREIFRKKKIPSFSLLPRVNKKWVYYEGKRSSGQGRRSGIASFMPPIHACSCVRRIFLPKKSSFECVNSTWYITASYTCRSAHSKSIFLSTVGKKKRSKFPIWELKMESRGKNEFEKRYHGEDVPSEGKINESTGVRKPVDTTRKGTHDEGKYPFMTSEQVRSNFIDFFKEKNHTVVESASVIPYNDNTLLFTNAGMNQFKKIFLGNVDKNSELGKLKRAVDTQKCIRAGGKHNDLDDVGKDVYHHTFFEMLGNWSFGNYFKEESIDYAWDLLTNVYKLNANRLYVTYFGGDKNIPSCPEDLETKKIWSKYLDEKRILPFGMKENFWEMAETGPCGPCSEIHYDRIGNRDASHLVNKDDPSVLEIWNIVFMQYNKDENKNMNKLPFPCIDTGMGLERITSILQNVDSNYDTDLFIPIFKQIKEMFNYIPDYEGKINEEDINKVDYAYRVISDHIRCVTIAISDGCLPGNEGRNYVIRRIIRRAVRVGKQVFNIKTNVLWFYRLVDSVCKVLGNCFKDLHNEDKVNHIKNTIKQEEMIFNRTLEKGVDKFHKLVKKGEKNTNMQGGTFSGKDAFDLYTSYGFPIDLIEIMCEEKNVKLNMNEFNDLFKKHQLISDTNNFKITKFFDLPVEKAYELKSHYDVLPTVDYHKYNWKNNEQKNDIKVEAVIQVIYDGTNFLDYIEHTGEEKKYALILSETNFYYENGGQIYDTGLIKNKHMNFQVLNVQKMNDYVLHIGVLLHGGIKKHDTVETFVNFERRKLVACNHTATHLLNFVIRKVLAEYVTKREDGLQNGCIGKDDVKSEERHLNGIAHKEDKEDDGKLLPLPLLSCDQKGSLVDEEKLRFDFSFFESLDIKLIDKIEKEINILIKEELDVTVKTMDLRESKKIKGIRAIFEEDYADKVNVVFIDKNANNILHNLDVNYTYLCSIELCGGTHIANTKFLNDFIITSEESIGKGIYRICAVTNQKAQEIKKKFDDLYVKYKHIFEDPNENNLTDVQSYKRILKEDKFLPYLKKNYILQNLEKIEKNIIEKEKNMQKELFNMATNVGKAYAVEDKKDNILLDLKLFDELNGNQKVLEKIVQAYNKHKKTLSYFFIITDESNTYCVFEIKDSLKNKNMQADVFMKEVMKSVDGHSGGGKNKAFGSAAKDKGVELKNVVQEAVKKYLHL